MTSRRPLNTSLEVVIPVLNEQRTLAQSVDTVQHFLSTNLGAYDWRVLIADNGSTDATPEIASGLSESYDRVRYLRLEQRGRGRALSKAWLASDADVLCYMDVDLSTELAALPELVGAIVGQGYDLAIGSRLKTGARVIGRSMEREVVSRVYNLIVRSMFWTGFQDAQCGFKAISRQAARELVPLARDTGWFFDTELLILAEKNGYRIKEMPVRWTDDPDTRVRVVRTSYQNMRGLLRLRFGGLRRAAGLLAGPAGNDQE